MSLTMRLDCMGFDADAVLQKLEEVKNTIFILFGAGDAIGDIQGWPVECLRVKGGIDVRWQTMVNSPLHTSIPTIHTQFHLSVRGIKRQSGDFSITGLDLQKGPLR